MHSNQIYILPPPFSHRQSALLILYNYFLFLFISIFSRLISRTSWRWRRERGGEVGPRTVGGTEAGTRRGAGAGTEPAEMETAGSRRRGAGVESVVDATRRRRPLPRTQQTILFSQIPHTNDFSCLLSNPEIKNMLWS